MIEKLTQHIPPLLQIPPGNDLLDVLIYILGILFILSVITEKLTQIVRMYPHTFRSILIAVGVFFYIPIVNSFQTGPLSVVVFIVLLVIDTAIIALAVANLSSTKKYAITRKFRILQNVQKTKGIVSANPYLQEREVTLLSFLVGFAVAYVFNADFLSLIADPTQIGKAKPIEPFFFQNGEITINEAYFNFRFITGIGLALTAFFLSFGSKFFHDLLDNLLQVKNLRRNLTEITQPQTSTTPGNLTPTQIKDVLTPRLDILKKYPGFESANVEAELTSAGKKFLINLHFNKDVSDEVKRQLDTIFQKEGIPIKISETKPAARVRVGKVSHVNEADYIGSVACGLRDSDGNESVLTCAHVLLSGNFEPDRINDINLNENVNLTLRQGRTPASWFYGYQDDTLDIALIKTREQITPSGLTAHTPSQDDLGDLVHFQGAVTDNGFGFLKAVDETCPVLFENETTVNMRGLLKLAHTEFGIDTSIAAGGDSGSLLFDEQNRALGIVLASTDEFTYAIPMGTILDKVNQQII
jgi:hypothetical protein